MHKWRLLSAFAGLFFLAFGFVFMIGTSFLTLIPFMSELLILKGEGFTIYYGLDFIRYVLANLPNILFFGDVNCIFCGIILIFTAIVCVAVIIASFFKKRNEMMFYVVPLFGMGFGISLLSAFFFGLKLYHFEEAYNYFQIVILNLKAPILTKVFFIVIFVNYVLVIFNYLMLMLFVFVAPARTDAWLAKQYEKEFATIKEVRQVSNEEFAKYISEHANEVREMLGLAPLEAPVDAQPVTEEAAVAQPVQEEVAAPAPVEAAPVSSTPTGEEIAAQVANALAMSGVEDATSAKVVIEANGVKSSVEVNKEPKPAEEVPALEEGSIPVEEAAAEAVVEEAPATPKKNKKGQFTKKSGSKNK